MNNEDIIRMAKEAGFADGIAEIMGLEGFYNFAALVAAAEREKFAEESAELLQALQNLHQRCHWADAPEEMDAAKAAIDKAIWARGEA